MRRRMRIATMMGAASLCLAGAGAVLAGPTPPSEALRSSQANNSMDASTVAVSGDFLLPSDQQESSIDISSVGASVDEGSPRAAALSSKERRSSSRAPSPTPGIGIWHPGLEDGQLLAAPLSLSSDTATDATPANNPIIPLPNAAWTGLTMLFLLAIVRFFRNLRRLLT